MNFKNYYPHFTCGSCSAHLALVDFSAKDIIEKSCSKCSLYLRGIQVLDKNLYLYRNIFIESFDKQNTFMGKLFSMKNRDAWFETIIECCDYIDQQIGG